MADDYHWHNKIGVTELSNFKEFLSNGESAQVQLDPTKDEILRTAIQEAGAFTQQYFHGPFDQVPDPKIGTDEVLIGLQEKGAALAKASAQVVSKVREAGLAELAEPLTEYFQGAIRRNEVVIEKVERPMEEKIQEFRRRAGSAGRTLP